MSEATPRVTIRVASEADWPQVVELLSRVFNGWPAFEIPVAPLEHLRWKIRSDPIAPRHQWVAESENQIVGTVLRVVRRIRVRGRDYLARDGVDAAVDPRHEGQGLHTSILDRAKESPADSQFDLRVSFSTNPKIRLRSPRRGFKPIANPIQVLEKPYRARAIVKRRREKYGGRLPAPLAALRIKLETIINRVAYRPYWRPARHAWSIITLDRFDDRMQPFFEEAARPFDFVIVRSKDYMNWRYCDPAGGRFTVRMAEEQGRILGYLVLKMSEGNGYLVDLLALPGRLDVVRSLVEDALRFFRDSDVELVTCWMISRHPYDGVLRRYGFIDSRRDVGFRYRAVNLQESEVAFLGNADARVHLTLGDSDWI